MGTDTPVRSGLRRGDMVRNIVPISRMYDGREYTCYVGAICEVLGVTSQGVRVRGPFVDPLSRGFRNVAFTVKESGYMVDSIQLVLGEDGYLSDFVEEEDGS